MVISFILSYSESFFVVFYLSFYFVLGQVLSARDRMFLSRPPIDRMNVSVQGTWRSRRTNTMVQARAVGFVVVFPIGVWSFGNDYSKNFSPNGKWADEAGLSYTGNMAEVCTCCCHRTNRRCTKKPTG